MLGVHKAFNAVRFAHWTAPLRGAAR